MDLGIAGKRAIICGASKGLGKACAEALAREGVKITIAARHLAQLAETAEEIRKATGNRVTSVVADVTTAEGRQAVLAACTNPDILITNSGGPPAGDFRDWNEVRVAPGAAEQHDHPHPDDQSGGGRDGRPALGPHRQHHLGGGEVALSDRSACRTARAPG